MSANLEIGVAQDLLAIRGWSGGASGNLVWRHEKRGEDGAATALFMNGPNGHSPDFVGLDTSRSRPLIIGNVTRRTNDIDAAVRHVKEHGRILAANGVEVLAAGIAGPRDSDFTLRVLKEQTTVRQSRWRTVDFQKNPIQWLPTPAEAETLLQGPRFTLEPSVPPHEVLAARCDEINRVLRECRIKDEYRPAVVGAFMLALVSTAGRISRDKTKVLPEINRACARAFRKAKKTEIAASLRLDTANETLAARAAGLLSILRLLNVSTLAGAHDYLGQLYEEFFRFTGGNTIGQFFTPRHITRFMADLVGVRPKDVIVDPTCGTGGFLIAALAKMTQGRTLTRPEIGELVAGHLYGFESEPVTAALCVANMILRGDGTTGVVKGDCFIHPQYPQEQATAVLGNPPFPHKASDDQPERFIDRGLEALADGGVLAMVIPRSLFVKGPHRAWRAKILSQNQLRAVIKLPDELFLPYAKAYTSIVVLKKGRPHASDDPVFFARIENDGFRLKKNVRLPRAGGQLESVLEGFLDGTDRPGWHGWSELSESDWSSGAHIASAAPSSAELRREIQALLQSELSAFATHVQPLSDFLGAIDAGDLRPRPFHTLTDRQPATTTRRGGHLGDSFLVYYGQRALHAKAGLPSGVCPVISSSGRQNGYFGFFDFDQPIAPPFATIPSTGSIGEGFVQPVAAGVSDDSLIIVPKAGVPPEALYIAVASVRLERWRFNYGRKLTPARIMDFKVPLKRDLLDWVRARVDETSQLRTRIRDAHTARPGDSAATRFRVLADQWRRATELMPSVVKMTAHPAYQQIIGMGQDAVPLLLRDLADNGPDHWFIALSAITRENPLSESDAGNLGRMTEAWIQWGKNHGYLLT